MGRTARWLLALAAGGVTAFAVALPTAVVLAIVDLYLNGHQMGSIRKEISGVALSVADILLLTASAVSGALVVWTLRPRPGRP